MKFFHKHKINPVALFYLKISLIISLVIVAISAGIYARNNRLLLEAVKQQAASYFDLIVRIRRWNSDYGGVYVEKKEGVKSNPYLLSVGIEPDTRDKAGTLFTMKNPALMTKELSTVYSNLNGIRFHITSLKLMNHENAPDAFELRALEKLAGGQREYWEIEKKATGSEFRYMAPLPFEFSCQKCHFKFNYRIGDIRGGISITIPFAGTEREMRLNSISIVGLSLLTLTLLLGSTFIMLNNMGNKIDAAQNALLEASIRDELTGLHNRRFLMSRLHEEYERARRNGTMLGLLMLDIDYFKNINDRYGHPAGDEVLRSVAQNLAFMLREYDVAGRYGGEEFVVVSTGTTAEDLVRLADRIRERIESLEMHGKAPALRVTVSIGVSALEECDSAESLLKRADVALYRAKHRGRNRTVLY